MSGPAAYVIFVSHQATACSGSVGLRFKIWKGAAQKQTIYISLHYRKLICYIIPSRSFAPLAEPCSSPYRHETSPT